MRRLLLPLAIATMFSLCVPMMASADDNDIANFIMQKLKSEQQRGNLRGFHVDMKVDKGTVWFEGFVANTAQEQLILRTAQQAGHLGVRQVVDDISIRGSQSYMSSKENTRSQKTQTANRRVARPVNFVQDTGAIQDGGAVRAPMVSGPMGSGMSVPPTPSRVAPGAMSGPVGPAAMAGQGGPVPVGHAGYGGPMATDHPQMPGYAWPGYAAHPNYGAVSYPKQYSPTAWPYIGPFYPYPQVPLGWRKVTLEWDDGWWYLDFNDR